MPPIALPPDYDPSEKEWNANEFRRVVTTGKYHCEKTMLVTPRFAVASGHSGGASHAGAHAVVPFELSPNNVIMVNRGWVPRDMTAAELASEEFCPRGSVKIHGMARSNSEPAAGYPRYSESKPDYWPSVDSYRMADRWQLKATPVIVDLLDVSSNAHNGKKYGDA